VQLNALFCCIWRNIVASCHKHFVVFSCNQHHRLLPVMCHNLRHAGCVPPATAFTTPACCRVNTGSQARYRLRITINAYPPAFDAPISGFHRNIAMPFSMEKLEWCGYPMVKKIERYLYFVLTLCTNVIDTHTDIASRSKNYYYYYIYYY